MQPQHNVMDELPLGFGMALARQPEALQAFGNLSNQQQRLLVDRARQVDTRAEMQLLVDSLLPQNRM